MTLLCDLARKYDTDKYPGWHDNTGHGYTPFYHHLLSAMKPERILEIGICSNTVCGAGPSLRMWADYFPSAQVYGIDNCPWVMLNEDRIHSFFYDQSSAADWMHFIQWSPKFDLIIDDGSHHPDHQILSANTLIPFLSPGGLYIIEDVQPGESQYIQDRLPYSSELVELDLARRTDDRLIIVRG